MIEKKICPLGFRETKSTDPDLMQLYPTAIDYLERFGYHVETAGRYGQKNMLVSDMNGHRVVVIEAYVDKSFMSTCIRFAYNLWLHLVR